MKPEARVLGIDDAPFDKFHDKTALIVGCFYRSNKLLEGVLSTNVCVDGDDATDKIGEMINSSKFKPQIQVVFLDGIAVAGLNVIDIQRLHNMIKIPVIVVMRRRPNKDAIKDVLKGLNMEKKIKFIENAGDVFSFDNIFFQKAGINEDEAREYLKLSIRTSDIPEALRIAHIIGAGIVKGESRGRA